MAYTKSYVKSEKLLELLIGFVVEGDHPRERVIRQHKNFYGLHDEGLALFEKLKEDLEAIDFFQSQVDSCAWYK